MALFAWNEGKIDLVNLDNITRITIRPHMYKIWRPASDKYNDGEFEEIKTGKFRMDAHIGAHESASSIHIGLFYSVDEARRWAEGNIPIVKVQQEDKE